MELLKLYDNYDWSEDNCIYLLFKDSNELTKAKGLIETAVNEWNENCLYDFELLDENIKNKYSFLIDNSILCELDYIYYILNTNGIEYENVDCKNLYI